VQVYDGNEVGLLQAGLEQPAMVMRQLLLVARYWC
jgi:hypothetical protein